MGGKICTKMKINLTATLELETRWYLSTLIWIINSQFPYNREQNKALQKSQEVCNW